MNGKINVRAVIAFILLFLIGIVVLITLGNHPLYIFAAVVYWTVLFLIIYFRDKLDFGKYFGGKT